MSIIYQPTLIVEFVRDEEEIYDPETGDVEWFPEEPYEFDDPVGEAFSTLEEARQSLADLTKEDFEEECRGRPLRLVIRPFIKGEDVLVLDWKK